MRHLDKKHFDDEKIVQMDADTITFVMKIFEDGAQRNAAKAEASTPVVEPKRRRLAFAEHDISQSQNEDDDFMLSILDSAAAEDNERNRPEHVNAGDAIADLRQTIKQELKQFKSCCRSFCMMELLDEYGTEKYKAMKKANKIQDTKFKVPTYVKPFFDVLKWWKKDGMQKFPHLAVAAFIILGKPSHNGFQERVFSTGTFKDSRLMKRRHEDNFEMAVLEHVNGDTIQEHDIYKTQLTDCSIIASDTDASRKHAVTQFFNYSHKFRNYEQRVNTNPPSDSEEDSTGSHGCESESVDLDIEQRKLEAQQDGHEGPWVNFDKCKPGFAWSDESSVGSSIDSDEHES